MTNETAAIKPLADAARDAVKAKFDKISADPAYKAVVNDETPAGEPSPIADRFINNFVTNGASANIKQMKLNLANEPLANQAISAATIDNLKAASKADPTTGKFLADPYNKSLTNQSPKLTDLIGPESAQQLKAVGNVAKNVSAQPAGSFVNNSNSLTSALSDTAKTGLSGLLAVKSLGISLAAEKAAAIYKANKASGRAVAPAAGVTRLSDVSP